MQTAEECFTGSGRIVGGQSPPCLPRSAASAGNFPEWLWALLAQTRWSDRPRPSLPQIPAPGWHSTSSANVRRCTTSRPGATDRRPAAAAGTGTAAKRDKLPPSSADNFGSCSRFLQIDCNRRVLARTWRTLLRVCVLSSRESVDTWSLSRRRETTCSRVEMPEEGCLLCCSAVHQVCLLAIL